MVRVAICYIAFIRNGAASGFIHRKTVENYAFILFEFHTYDTLFRIGLCTATKTLLVLRVLRGKKSVQPTSQVSSSTA